MIAKEDNCVVSACDGCVKSIVDRLSLLPEYPENIDYVFNSFLLLLRKYFVFVHGYGCTK